MKIICIDVIKGRKRKMNKIRIFMGLRKVRGSSFNYKGKKELSKIIN